jgi:hypothetical protein
MEEVSTTDRPRPMSPTSLVNLSSLIDDAKCYALVRRKRRLVLTLSWAWPV